MPAGEANGAAAIAGEASQDAQSFAELPDLLFRLKPGTSVEPLDDSAILFDENDQRLHRLNSSSAMLASRLAKGATLNDLIAELEGWGIDPQQSLDWATKFLLDASRKCVLAADFQTEQLPVANSSTIQIGALGIQLDFSSIRLSEVIGSPYAHLAGSKTPAQCRFQVSQTGRFVFISKNGSPAEVIEAELAGIRLKGMVVEEALGAPGHLAAFHAANLARGKHGLLLVGAPASGKSTLSLTLLKHGFRYGSDDVTLLRPDGSMIGVPLAPTVKDGAWDIADRLGWTLSDLPAHLRPDGQRVRFAKLSPELLASPHSIRTIIMLRRTPRAEGAMEPIHPAEALANLMRESRSPSGTCSSDILSRLANVVRGASSYSLSYCEAIDAVPLIQAVVDNG